jgi:hypothetical protein
MTPKTPPVVAESLEDDARGQAKCRKKLDLSVPYRDASGGATA